jgi:hypothetical protein
MVCRTPGPCGDSPFAVDLGHESLVHGTSSLKRLVLCVLLIIMAYASRPAHVVRQSSPHDRRLPFPSPLPPQRLVRPLATTQ